MKLKTAGSGSLATASQCKEWTLGGGQIRYWCPWCREWFWMKDNPACIRHKAIHRNGGRQ
uniref:C2H2-type domain-containing protein n=1 Tax=viral metagenome TaxID=1070528 RepID=A0A6H2A262_9ZZZZ